MRRNSVVLNRAADLIETNGFQQFYDGWTGKNGGYCLEGALFAAMGKRPHAWIPLCATTRANFSRPGRAVREFLDLSWKTPLMAWNDRLDSRSYRYRNYGGPVTTKSRVVEVLRAAALVESLKEEQQPQRWYHRKRQQTTISMTRETAGAIQRRERMLIG